MKDKERILEYEEIVLTSRNERRPYSFDLRCYQGGGKKPLILFAPGLKTFKDWGPFNLVANTFAEAGFAFAKLNFSFNGVTKASPDVLIDKEAFGRNTLSMELNDLDQVIDCLLDEKQNPLAHEIDKDRLYLIGHSRGGALAIIKTREDPRVKGVVTWASLCDFEKMWWWFTLLLWRIRGVYYEWDQWHHQYLPMYYVLAEDYYMNKKRLHLPSATKELQVPALFMHAKNDPILPVSSCTGLCSNKPDAEYYVLEEGEHLFGMKHPYTEEMLPTPLQTLVDKSIAFIQKHCR